MHLKQLNIRLNTNVWDLKMEEVKIQMQDIMTVNFLRAIKD